MVDTPETKTDSQSRDTSLASLHEGGKRGWFTIAGAWFALFATFGYLSSFGVYEDLYVRAGAGSSSRVSWIGSTQQFFFVAMALPAGKLLDKGYFKSVIGIGSIIYIFSLFMLSLSHVDRYYQLFLSQGVGMGIGAGLVYLPSLAVQAHHWQTRRAMAMGIAITGSSVGGIVYPIMLNNLFHGSVGFAWGVRWSGFLSLAALLIANILMTSKPRHYEDENLDIKPKWRDIYTDIPFITTFVGGFFVVLGLFFPYFYLQLFSILHRLPPTFAFYTLTIQNGASIFGRTIPNVLADRYGPLNVIIIMVFGTGILIFGMLGVHNVAGVVVFAIFYGFFSGGVLALITPVLASFVKHPSELGLRLGVSYLAVSLAYLTGPPIAGALVGDGLNIHWSRPVVFSGTMVTIGGLITCFARIMESKRKGTPLV